MVYSVKMVGLFTVGSIGLVVAIDLWNLLDIRNGLPLVRYILVITWIYTILSISLYSNNNCELYIYIYIYIY